MNFKLVELMEANPNITRDRWIAYLSQLFIDDECEDIEHQEEVDPDEIASWAPASIQVIDQLSVGSSFRATDEYGSRAVYTVIAKDDDGTSLYVPIEGTEALIIGMQLYDVDTCKFNTIAIFDVNELEAQVEKLTSPFDIIRFIDGKGEPLGDIDCYDDPKSTYIVDKHGDLESVTHLLNKKEEMATLSNISALLLPDDSSTRAAMANGHLFHVLKDKINDINEDGSNAVETMEWIKSNLLNLVDTEECTMEEVTNTLSFLGSVVCGLPANDDFNDAYESIYDVIVNAHKQKPAEPKVVQPSFDRYVNSGVGFLDRELHADKATPWTVPEINDLVARMYDRLFGGPDMWDGNTVITILTGIGNIVSNDQDSMGKCETPSDAKFKLADLLIKHYVYQIPSVGNTENIPDEQ